MFIRCLCVSRPTVYTAVNRVTAGEVLLHNSVFFVYACTATWVIAVAVIIPLLIIVLIVVIVVIWIIYKRT